MHQRYVSIDFLRGAAILAMIQGHILEYFIAKPNGLGIALHLYFVAPVGAYAAPLFILISGASAYLARRNREVGAVLRIRGALLFALSSMVVVLSNWLLDPQGATTPLNWGPIQLIGFCLVLVPWFARARWPIRLMIVVLIALAPLVWRELPGTPLIGLFARGFAPFFPWGALFFGGYMIGEFAFRQPLSPGGELVTALTLCTGLAMLMLLLVALMGLPFEWAHRANPNVTSLVGFVAIFAALLAVTRTLLDEKRIDGRLIRCFSGFGQRALTIYYLQLLGIVAAARAYAAWAGRPAEMLWQWFLPAVGLAALGLHLGINVAWKAHGHAYSLEWLLARGAGMLQGRHGRVGAAQRG